MHSLPLFFAELKRRKVFKVAAVFGATSFVLLQIADIVFPALGLPQWTITLIVALIVIGFAFVLVMTWGYTVAQAEDFGRKWAIAAKYPQPEEAAIAYLEQAFVDQDPSIILISALYEFNPLRKDPRFIRIIQQLGVANGI